MRNIIFSTCSALGSLGLILSLLAGCAARDTKAGANTSAIPDQTKTSQKPDSKAVDGKIEPRVKAIDGALLNPLKPSTAKIQYTQGSHEGETVSMTMKPGKDKAWSHEVEGIRTMSLMVEDGRLVMPSEEDMGENVAITYDPPFVLLPAKVASGHKHQSQTRMIVKNLKTGSVRDSGPCNYTVELLGMQTIATPAGPFEAYVFKTVREIDLSLAKVKVTILTAHVPERGIVMTRVEQNTKAIGIFSMNKTEEWRLAK